MKKVLCFIAAITLVAAVGVSIRAATGDFATLGYNTVSGHDYWRVNSSGNLVPGAASTYAIGDATYKMSAVYSDSVVMSGGFQLKSKTLAELNALTPSAAGEMYFCSDCTNTLAISSGTSAGAFVTAASSTTHIS